MKTNIHILAAALAGLFAGADLALAVPVTYNVDMSVQTALGNFHPGVDTVLVSGTFCNWTTTNVMTATVADTNVYTLAFNDTADAVGGYEDHKFVINPNGNSSGASLNWESIPNRYFQVPAVGTNLPTVFFNDLTSVPSTPVSITFQLDMQIAIQQGIFTMGSDYVDAFGSWNSWAATGVLLTNVAGTSNYVGTLTTTNLTLNSIVNYKYAINGSGGTWEGNVGSGGGANRSVTITNFVQTFPLDYWNNVTSANFSFAVGFGVDMTVENAFGVFTPGTDTVFVNGDWNWSGSAMQLAQVGASDLYTGAVTLAYSPGTTVNYKYTIDGGLIWENNGVGPGGAQNHQFVLNASTNLPADYFNNYSNLGPLTISNAGDQTILFWSTGTNANNTMRLQSAGSLPGTWSDIAITPGQSSVTNESGAGPAFFRLIWP